MGSGQGSTPEGDPSRPDLCGLLLPRAKLISSVGWLYFRFPLSLRMVEEMLAARGIRAELHIIPPPSAKGGNMLE